MKHLKFLFLIFIVLSTLAEMIFSQTNDEAYERCLKLHGKVVADSFDSTAKDYLIETLKAFKHNSNTDNSTLCSSRLTFTHRGNALLKAAKQCSIEESSKLVTQLKTALSDVKAAAEKGCSEEFIKSNDWTSAAPTTSQTKILVALFLCIGLVTYFL